jgi:hypothetical protein
MHMIAVVVVELQHGGGRLGFEREFEPALMGRIDGTHADFVVRLICGRIVGKSRRMTNPQQHQPPAGRSHSAFKYIS